MRVALAVIAGVLSVALLVGCESRPVGPPDGPGSEQPTATVPPDQPSGPVASPGPSPSVPFPAVSPKPGGGPSPSLEVPPPIQ